MLRLQLRPSPRHWNPFGFIAHGTQKITAGGGEDLVGQRSVRGYDRPRQHERSHHLRIERYGALARRPRVRYAAAIIALFFGQRVAKEYAGAAVLVPYFLLTLVAIYLLAQG